MNLGKYFLCVYNFVFSGGLELLFNKNKKMDLDLDDIKDAFYLKDLIEVLKTKITDKHDFFLTKDNQM